MSEPALRSEVDDDLRALARWTAQALDGSGRVVRRWTDDDGERWVDVLSVATDDGTLACATLGLSRLPLPYADPALGLELLATGPGADGESAQAGSILSACAFVLEATRPAATVGTVLTGAVAESGVDGASRLPHALLTAPFSRPDGTFATRRFGTREVAWLEVVPVAASEVAYADEHGVDALLDLLAAAQVVPADLGRPPVV